MPAEKRVLVVGTTADYIHWIQRICTNDVLFLTDTMVRKTASQPPPPPADEIICNLSDNRRTRNALLSHLGTYGIQLSGVVSFDCESMALAADIAQRFALSYPSVEAVNNCRNKYLAKRLWNESSLCTPSVRLVGSAHDAAAFYRELNQPCVLKPLSGSGSELIYRCDTEDESRQYFDKIQTALQARAAHRLYQPFHSEAPAVLAEAFVPGDEYSCDFIIENEQATIIRLTRKIPSRNGLFGTTLGYTLSTAPPGGIDESALSDTLLKSAKTLGVERALCMLDFIIQENRIVLLELAPRPGGDCLPYLLRRAMGLDILKLFLDFARQLPLCLPPPSGDQEMTGLRLLAARSGVLRQIDVRRLRRDDRVREICITRSSGHRITMPPDDYDSWCLGHIIVRPDADGLTDAQCRALVEQVSMDIE